MDKLGKFDLKILQQQANQYFQDLQGFIDKHNLSELAQNNSVDHLAVKAYDSEDYGTFINSVLNSASEVSFTRLNNRRLGSANLTVPISFGVYGQSNLLEIMEPKPEKVGDDLVGFEHIELFHPDLELVMKILKDKGIDYKFAQNPHHQAVVVKINDLGQEVKFTDKHLGEIIKAQVKDGSSTVI